MPELPEVETIRQQLDAVFRRKRILRLVVRTPQLLQNCTPEQLRSVLEGKRLQAVKRRGKFLIFDCEGAYPVFHLGMSGIFLQSKEQSRFPQHIHLAIQWDSGKWLYYQDVRKFGKIWLYRQPPRFPGLGPEPLDKKFTLSKLKKLLNLTRLNIKRFLMDQSRVAGIGNIYANEILFEAGISPLRPACSLNEEEIQRLHGAIRRVLKSAIQRFGTTYSAYRTVTGENGQNQHFLKVYQRAGQPCFRCGEPIARIWIDKRSTFFCPKCQR
ncbi:MAG: bifunctional DNA-formamidopyrimidine glycosylase/DNA-(apurinic or apyrimidinic site) lyase [Calditrichaeota bacterium]|nr:MAG: bifunctional DNA-formamidopyrimidine glycosylase/DNA-(apurinic or apyrimidinic site) lyase [Calditrichota bacterium]